MTLTNVAGSEVEVSQRQTQKSCERDDDTFRITEGILTKNLHRHLLHSGHEIIDREFVTAAKKFANFNEFSEIKKIRKNSYKNSLNARVDVAFQWNSLFI